MVKSLLNGKLHMMQLILPSQKEIFVSMGGRRMGDPCLGSILPVQLNILKDTWGLLLLQISVNNISVNAEHCLFDKDSCHVYTFKMLYEEL